MRIRFYSPWNGKLLDCALGCVLSTERGSLHDCIHILSSAHLLRLVIFGHTLKIADSG